MLQAIQEGRPQEAEGLLPAVYQELRKIAAARMAQEAPGHTLQPTALGLSLRNAERTWAYARAWLRRKVSEGGS